MAARLTLADAVSEAAVLATCNRLEIYAEVTSFHGGLNDIAAALEETTAVPMRTMGGHLYAHHADEAVRHLFTVVCGMDSMALGESQVLGQVREMLTTAQAQGTIGRSLVPLLQRALHVGKRAFAETGLARTGHSLVAQALTHTDDVGLDLGAARALVVGAGAMSSLSASVLARAGVPELVIANRSRERGERLAEQVGGRAVLLGESIVEALSVADIIVTCTGATGVVLTLQRVAEARQERAVAAGGAPPPQLIVDLALPHDVAPEVSGLPGVTVIGLADLHAELADLGVGEDLNAVSAIIEAETMAQLASQRAEQATPAVVALRAYAEEVAAAELTRLRGKVGDLDPAVLAEVERTVHRVVDKLLHRPTVRVKALAAEADGDHYARTLAELFDLTLDNSVSLHDLTQVLAVEVVRR